MLVCLLCACVLAANACVLPASVSKFPSQFPSNSREEDDWLIQWADDWFIKLGAWPPMGGGAAYVFPGILRSWSYQEHQDNRLFAIDC